MLDRRVCRRRTKREQRAQREKEIRRGEVFGSGVWSDRSEVSRETGEVRVKRFDRTNGE